MAKKITFTYDEREYTLEYSRATIEAMEKGGFNITEADTKPMSTIHKLFVGAFRKNHPSLSSNKIDEIFDNMDNVGGLLKVLVEMYKEAIETLTDESVSEGKVKWEER